MIFYDYLFFKSYQLAQKSKNFDDAPVLGGIWGVIPCFMLNLFTIMFVVDALFKSNASKVSIYIKQYKYLFAGALVLSLLLHYRYKGRWKNIIEKYENKEAQKGKTVHPAFVLIIAYVLSFLFGMLSAMYKNGDGIFK